MNSARKLRKKRGGRGRRRGRRRSRIGKRGGRRKRRRGRSSCGRRWRAEEEEVVEVGGRREEVEVAVAEKGDEEAEGRKRGTRKVEKDEKGESGVV